MPGCIIFEISSLSGVDCPDPGTGGIGAGNGTSHGSNGCNATNYGCGGGCAGFYAFDSDGKYITGKGGEGMQGCIILEIDTTNLKNDGIEQVYAVDWTAASDKEYRYIVTGCNYESSYRTRHNPEEMIEL